jgi:carboxylesterase type B
MQSLMDNMFEQLSSKQFHSEMNCLHLNIYAPPQALEWSNKLLVLALIHGGAFNTGDNTTEFGMYSKTRREIGLDRTNQNIHRR